MESATTARRRVNTAVFASGERSVFSPYSIASLLKFCNTEEATILRAAARLLRDAVADFTWDDGNTAILE
jgi:hypothetical protein